MPDLLKGWNLRKFAEAVGIDPKLVDQFRDEPDSSGEKSCGATECYCPRCVKCHRNILPCDRCKDLPGSYHSDKCPDCGGEIRFVKIWEAR